MKKWAAISAGVIVGYCLMTWFFFGSPHPCGILEARQRPFVLARVKETDAENLQFVHELMSSGSSAGLDLAATLIQGRQGAEEEALRSLHHQVWNLTPGECAKNAVSLDANPYRK